MTCGIPLRQSVVLLAAAAMLQVGCSRFSKYPGLTEIDGEWVERLCESTGKDCLEIDEITKSSDGRELRVVFRMETVVVTPSGEAHVYKKPGRLAWMNDSHEWIAWTDDYKYGFYVLSQSARKHEYGYPRFDSGGRFFAVTGGDETRLFRVNPFRHEATLELSVAPNVFSRPPFIFIVGPDREMRRLHLFKYRDTETGVEFVESRVIERPDGAAASPFYVSDVAGTGELLTIHDVSDAQSSESSILVYEASADRLTAARTGTLPWATLFLAQELQKRVNNGSRFTLAPAAPVRSSVVTEGIRQ